MKTKIAVLLVWTCLSTAAAIEYAWLNFKYDTLVKSDIAQIAALNQRCLDEYEAGIGAGSVATFELIHEQYPEIRAPDLSANRQHIMDLINAARSTYFANLPPANMIPLPPK
jgi:hypothetical protein